MLFKLNKNNPGVHSYTPPIPIPDVPEGADPYGGIDRTKSEDEQITCLLWIPAYLVCRFLFQFPVLHCERDELFSAGLFTLVETVKTQPDIPGDKIGAYVHTNAIAAMEAYCNNLGEAVPVNTRTRYRHRKKNKELPESVRLTSDTEVREDDHTEQLLAEACEVAGINLETATLQEKRQLARTLGLEEYL